MTPLRVLQVSCSFLSAVLASISHVLSAGSFVLNSAFAIGGILVGTELIA
jgi:hypothetical protein